MSNEIKRATVIEECSLLQTNLNDANRHDDKMCTSDVDKVTHDGGCCIMASANTLEDGCIELEKIDKKVVDDMNVSENLDNSKQKTTANQRRLYPYIHGCKTCQSMSWFRVVAWFHRSSDTVNQFLKELFSPSLTHNNVKLLGCEKAVEEEKARSKQGYIIHPLSNFRQCWDLLIMLVMLINLFVLPLDVAFFIHAIDTFLTISDVLCIIDIIFNFRTGYLIKPEPKYFELDRKKIAKHYIKTWFIIDLIGSLPLQHIILGLSERHDSVSLGLKSASHVLKYWKVLKLIRLLKLLRLSRVIRAILMYEEVYRITTGFVRYIKLIFMMMIIAHWNGCIQFLIPMLQGFPKDCWVMLCNVKDEKWYVQYGWAIFKTLSHMLCIGYGQFIPKLLSEASITIFTMVTGATFYALFIANSMAYMIETDYSKITYREKRKRTKEFLAYRQIPDDLKHRVESYLYHKYSHGRYFEEDEVLSKISKPIREDIIRHTCNDVITNISVFKNASPQVISAILETVKSDIYLPGDVITNEGRVGSELYFVRDGVVEISIKDRVIETIKKGAHFGELNVLIRGKCLFTATATTVCDIVILNDDFYRTTGDNKTIHTLLEHAAIIQISKIYEKCKLANIIHSIDHGADDSSNALMEGHNSNNTMIEVLALFQRYLVKLLEEGKEGQNKFRLMRSSNVATTEDIDYLFTRLLQSHRSMHETCNISKQCRESVTMVAQDVERIEMIDKISII